MIIAQLSDPHIVARGKLFRCPVQGVAPDAERMLREFDTAPYLARAVTAVNQLVPRPDVTIVTGDLVDHGEPEEYEHLRALLAPLSMPVFVIPGNHDTRQSLREAFRSERYFPDDGYLYYAIDDYPLRLIALDTLVTGKHQGSLDDKQLAWLDATLAAQRASKILGIFARLERRDHKPQYLRHLPRVWAYLQRSLAHPALAPLAAWYRVNVPPLKV